MTTESTTETKVTRNRTLVGQYFVIALVCILFVMMMTRFVQPVLLGFLGALAMAPLGRRFRSWFGGRPFLAAAMTTFVAIICMLLPLVLLSLLVLDDAVLFTQDLALNGLNLRWPQWIYDYPKLVSLIPKAKDLTVQAGAIAGSAIGSWMASLPFTLVQTAIFIVTFFYGCAEGGKLVNFISSFLPFEKNEIDRLYETTEIICRGVIVGSLSAALVQSIIIGSGYLILGIPRAPLFSFLTFLFSLIPVIGAGPVGLGGVVYLYMHGSVSSAVVMLVLTGIATVSDNIVKPWILNGKAEMHPLLALVSALGGLTMFGFSGIIFGPLLAALAMEALKFLREQKV